MSINDDSNGEVSALDRQVLRLSDDDLDAVGKAMNPNFLGMKSYKERFAILEENYGIPRIVEYVDTRLPTLEKCLKEVMKHNPTIPAIPANLAKEIFDLLEMKAR